MVLQVHKQPVPSHGATPFVALASVLQTYKHPISTFRGHYDILQVPTATNNQRLTWLPPLSQHLGPPGTASVFRCLHVNPPLHAVLRSAVGVEVPLVPYQLRFKKSRNTLLSTRQNLNLEHVLGTPVTTESPTEDSSVLIVSRIV